MFIIHRLPGDILDSTIGNIKYRNNVVTGVVAVVNGNDTYDCYISGSDVAYPNIPTTVPEAAFAVDDSVEIIMEYGNKEMPIIIGYAKKIAQEFVEDEINVLVVTLDAYSITPTTAYFEGRVEDIEGYENVIRRGFYYGTSTGYGSDVFSTGSFEAGCYSEQATGLIKETTYHYQAYVYDADNDLHTGEDKTMTTNPILPGDLYIYHLDSDNKKIIVAYSTDGNLINSWGEPAELSNEYVRVMAVDANGNVYIGAGPNTSWFDWIFKYDNTANLLLSLDLSGDTYKPRDIVIGPDGKMYTIYRITTSDYWLQQRNLTDLTVDNEIELGFSVGGKVAFDSAGNFYTHNFASQRFERWTFTGGRQATYSITPSEDYLSWGSWETFATTNSVLSCFYEYWTGDDMIFTIPTAFGEAYTRHDPTDITTGAGLDSALVGMTSIGNNFLLIGKNSGGNLIIQKCNSSITKVWTTVVGSYSVVPGHRDAIIAAYPF